MAKVRGYQERLHSPIYDAFFVKDEIKQGGGKKTFTDFMTDPRVIRFFVDIQNKTELETNLQASGVLPSLNTFEARALRVVVSNLRLKEMKTRVAVETTTGQAEQTTTVEEALISESEILADLIYNSVTSLIVGEKNMIKMPTFWFPSGAGVSPGFPTVTNHGEPDPTATFRFAEPVYIEPQQQFRVEMSFPQGVPGAGSNNSTDLLQLANVTGPLRIWVVLDGYLTRDVQ